MGLLLYDDHLYLINMTTHSFIILDNLEFFKLITVFGTRTPSTEELINFVWTEPKLSFKIIYIYYQCQTEYKEYLQSFFQDGIVPNLEHQDPKLHEKMKLDVEKTKRLVKDYYSVMRTEPASKSNIDDMPMEYPLVAILINLSLFLIIAFLALFFVGFLTGGGMTELVKWFIRK